MSHPILIYFLIIGLIVHPSLYAQDKDSLLREASSLLIQAEKLNDSSQLAEAHYQLGKAHLQVNNSLAYDHFSLSLTYLDSMATPLKWAKTRQSLGSASYRLGNYTEALGHYKSVEPIFEQLGNSDQYATNQRKLGQVTDRLGISDQAFSYYEKSRIALLSAEKIDSFHLAGLLIDIGSVHSRQSNIQEALFYLKQAINIYERLNNLRNLPYALNNIAATHIREGNYLKALAYLQKALRMAEDGDLKRLASSVNGNIGGIYVSLNDNEKAIPYFEKSIVYAETIGNKAYQASSTRKLGSAYEQLGDTIRAMEYYEKSLEIYEETGAKHGIGIVHRSIGKLFADQGKDEQANFHLEAALKISKEVGDIKTLSHNYSALGEWKLKIGQYQEAIDHCLQGLELIEEIYMFRQIESNCNCLWRAHEKLGNYKASTHYLKRYMQARDSLFNEEKAEEMTRLEMQFEFDKEKELMELNRQLKEDQLNHKLARQNNEKNLLIIGLIVGGLVIVFLWRAYQINQKKNTLLAQQKKTIQVALEEKETLLREIHHRVKNNLQVVSSLLSLQSRTIKDPSVLDAIEEGRNRVKAMALIHQNLYQEENLVGVQLPQYIEKLTSNLVNSYKVNTDRVDIHCEISPISLDVDTLIPLGLILNELISNALKYAFPNQETGKIRIDVFQNEHGLNLKVKDDGVGMPQNFDIKKTTSMGFKLIRAFVQKMKAEMEITNEGGTQVSILLPPNH